MLDSTNSARSGYSYMLFSLQTISTTIMPLLLLLFSANMITSEKIFGTIRNILVVGCSKSQFLFSKVITCLIFQIFIMVMAMLTTIVIAYFNFGFGNISEDGIIILSCHQFWFQFIFAYSLLALVLFAVTTFGIMLSTFCRNSASAITSAIGIYIMLESVKSKLHIENLIYSSYIEYPLNVVSELVEGFHAAWGPKLLYLIFISTLWIFFSLSASFIIIKKLEFK